MKRTYRIILAVLTLVLALSLVLAGCSSQENGAVYVVSIAQTDGSGEESEFTVTYSDGTTSTFTVKNGKDGEDGAVSAADLYEEYKEIYGDDLTYEQFLEKYLTVSVPEDNSATIAKTLLSCVRVYTEFTTTTLSGGWGGMQQTKGVSVSTGAGVVYQMDEDYTYFVTNYHVVYNENANADNGSNIARKIAVYAYGSQTSPYNSGEKGSDGYDVIEYGSDAILCDYVGGAASLDIAILRADTDDVLNVNEDMCAVTLADGYSVGETAIAVGNPEDEGMSVTEGIVSVDSEYVTLSVDGTSRQYRSMRIDTALYEGNSGGGVFNEDGELIGLANAGDGSDQNVNYAIPVSIVKGGADNIIYNSQNGGTSGVTRPTLGVTVSIASSKYVYDEETASGKITETLEVSAVTEGSIAEKMGLAVGDEVLAFVINGTEHEIDRSFQIGDLLLTLRAGDKISSKIRQSGQETETSEYEILSSDLVSVE